ncbi:MAG: hypothetical protein ACFCUI_13330 [Bernardetiaceae bacterium]
MRPVIMSCFCLAVLLACTTEKPEVQVINPEPEIKIETISLDTLFVNLPACSYVGEFGFEEDTIYFIDHLFCLVSTLDGEGNLGSVHLGKGNGPDELPGFSAFLGHTNGKPTFLSGDIIYQFDSLWKNRVAKNIRWASRYTLREQSEKPNPKDPGIYEMRLPGMNDFLKVGDEYVIFAIESSHPEFNGLRYDQAKAYYENAGVFAKLNLTTGVVEEVLGRYPDLFKEQHIPNFAYAHTAFAKDTFFVSFEASPLIEVYDKEFQKIAAFGNAGNQMQTDYPDYVGENNFERIEQNYAQEHSAYGYYADMAYFPNQNLLFRTYTQGSSGEEKRNPRRLQIYKQKVLIGDVDVPDYFKVFGYSKGYFYADGFYDEANEKLAFYRFRLPL